MKKAKDLEELIKYCEPHSDAEEELLNCPFVYEYEDTPQSSPSVAVTPSEPTGILMLSVPSTDTDGQSSPPENEEFETPPEQNNSSQPYFSGSDDPKPSTSAGVDCQQNNNGDTEAVNHDNPEVVDLGNDSDDLGFPNRREVDVQDTGEFEEQLQKRYKVSEEDLDVTNSVQRIVKKEPIVIEINQTRTREVDTEVIGGGIERNADSSTVKMPERREEEEDGGEMRDNGERGVDDNETLNGGGTGEMDCNGIKDGVRERGAASMNLDVNEKLNGVCTKEMHSNGITTSVCVDGGGAGCDKGRRELPLSMRGEDKSVGSFEEVGRRETTKGRFKDLVEAFSMIVGDVSGDDNNDKNGADFLETAKRRGLSFPRPRWWPPEGFAD
ncbi:hypothetical protein H5410_043282 [Solanum commersonii]|uniref:Uncharacterized protein n=1 Tax=Solanum commersonii TaxID=4109 RepID=A0A9J5XZT9_SOLCO|nr:hypothetical protein H5410_043282 [Solanum commersonii]